MLRTIAFLGAVLPCFSTPPARPPQRYIQTTFTNENGLDSNIVNAVTQTANRLLWVGTMSGLSRFDGHNFLKVYSGEVFAVAQQPGGDLWMATSSGVARADQKALDRWGSIPITAYHLGKDTADVVDSLLIAHDGTVWAATRQGIYRFNGRGFQLVIPDIRANRIEQASNGNLLIIGSGRYLEWERGRLLEHPEISKQFGIGADGIYHVVDDRQGRRWYATKNGLMRIENGSVKRWIARNSASEIPVFRIYEAAAGKLFVSAGAGLTSGVYEMGEEGLDPVNVGKGGRALYGDQDADLWIGTNGSGLIREKESGLNVYSPADGLPTDFVTSVLTAHDGTLWVGNRCGGISWFDGERFHNFNEKHGLSNSCVTSLAEDAHHDLWVGTPDGVFRFRDGVFSLLWKQTAIRDQGIKQILCSRDDSMWLATDSGLVHLKGGVSRTYTTADGLSSDRITNVYQDRNGTIWVGTGFGIDHLREARFVPLSPSERGEGQILGQDPLGNLYVRRDSEVGSIAGNHYIGFGLPLDPHAMLSIGRDLWFSGNSIFRMTVQTAMEARTSSSEPLEYLALSSADGVTVAGHGRNQPQIAVTPDGRLWFAQFQGLLALDPSHFPPAPKPTVIMGRIIVDRDSRPPGQQLVLPRGEHHVELEFDTIEISSPERTKLQYRLDDVDSAWIDAPAVHSVSYSNIPVGLHRFHIRATNRDGVWDREGIAYNIIQKPFIYQTFSFRLVCALAGFFLMAGVYRIRLRQISEKVRARLEGRLSERERIARELHDTLLQGFHSVIMRFELVTSRLSKSEPEVKELEVALDRAREVMIEGRNRVRDLRSVLDEGVDLPESLARSGREIVMGSSIEISLKVNGKIQDLQPSVWEEVYRLGHEAVFNSFQHANAKRIQIEVTYDPREFRACFRDDGCGFDSQLLKSGAQQGHWGLIGMRERADKIKARLAISSQPNTGTEITIHVPASTAYQRHQGVFRMLWRRLGLDDGAL